MLYLLVSKGFFSNSVASVRTKGSKISVILNNMQSNALYFFLCVVLIIFYFPPESQR
jgi:hypothetical protein